MAVEARIYCSPANSLQLFVQSIQKIGDGLKIFTESKLDIASEAAGRLVSRPSGSAVVSSARVSDMTQSFANVCVNGRKLDSTLVSGLINDNMPEIFYSDDSSSEDEAVEAEESEDGVEWVEAVSEKSAASPAVPTCPAAKEKPSWTLARNGVAAAELSKLTKRGKDVLAFKLFIQICAKEEGARYSNPNLNF